MFGLGLCSHVSCFSARPPSPRHHFNFCLSLRWAKAQRTQQRRGSGGGRGGVSHSALQDMVSAECRQLIQGEGKGKGKGPGQRRGSHSSAAGSATGGSDGDCDERDR